VARWLVALLVVAALVTPATFAVAQPVRSTAPALGPVVSYSALPPPDITAEAVYVFDATVGTELYALNPDDPHAPASLTKIATALVVLEHANLSETVTIEPSDVVGPDQSQVGLEVGDILTVQDLLYGMLMQSGNDAANALSRHVGEAMMASDPSLGNDPRRVFVDAMNQLAKSFNLRNTVFVNAEGLDAPGHHSSARDLGILAAYAMANTTFATIVATPSIVLPSTTRTEGYAISTTNDLLAEGLVIGVKTGTTEKAGGCYIAAALIGRNLIISVVLGSAVEFEADGNLISPARFLDTRAILDAAARDYLWVDLAVPDAVQGLAAELTAWEAAVPPGPALVVPAGRVADLRYRLQLGPPAAPNAPVGKVLFFVGSELLSERPVTQASA
jgi:D-alanyl-D-alanine carboxypeptidase (penicillin-binding protein 5/6)